MKTEQLKRLDKILTELEFATLYTEDDEESECIINAISELDKIVPRPLPDDV